MPDKIRRLIPYHDNAVFLDYEIQELLNHAEFVYYFDNTIADTTIAHYKSWVQAVHDVLNDKQSNTFFNFEDYFTKYNGFNLHKTIDTLCRKNEITINDTQVRQIITLKQQYFNQSLAKIRPFEQSIELIKYCADRNLQLVIASGSSQDEITSILNNGNFEGINSLFTKELIIGQGMYKKSKPAPDPYTIGKKAIEQLTGLQFSNDECLVIEDADVGILSAMNNNSIMNNNQQLNSEKLTHRIDCMHTLNIRKLTDTEEHIATLYEQGEEIQNQFQLIDLNE